MKNLNKTKILSFALATIILTACSNKNEEEQTPIKFKNSITINNKALYPEGIDYDNDNNVFIVGSFYKGEIGKVNPETGAYTTFITNPDLIGVTGVYTDEIRNRLIVAIADAGVSLKTTAMTGAKTAKIGIYDLKTGDKKALISLENISNAGNGKFANDIAVDNAGNIFVTNSFTEAEVYKIDTNNKVSLYVTIPNQTTDVGAFGLNGIVFHKPSGKLITGHSTTGKFYVISDTNGKVTFEESKTLNVPNIDGLEIDDKGKLIVVTNGTATVTTVDITTNTDNSLKFTKEKTVSTEKGSFPTTVTNIKDEGSFVLYSNLSKLFGGDKEFSQFKIVNINSLN